MNLHEPKNLAPFFFHEKAAAALPEKTEISVVKKTKEECLLLVWKDPRGPYKEKNLLRKVILAGARLQILKDKSLLMGE
jgi:hypothetical protein